LYSHDPVRVAASRRGTGLHSAGFSLPDTRVLLLGGPISDSLVPILARPGRNLTRTSTPEEAVEQAGQHDVVIIDAAATKQPGEICRDIRSQPERAGMPILVIATGDDVEERIQLLESGADDVITRPVDEREVDARIEALDLRFRRSKELRPSVIVSTTRRPGRRLVVVFSPKGGVGTTSVAVNLALALAARQPDGVLIVDLAAAIGQVATHLDVHPRLTVADLATELRGEDQVTLQNYLVRHRSGLQVLAAGAQPGMTTVDGDQASRLIDAALTAFPTVVVDAGSQLDERALAALAAADDVLIVVSPEFAALKTVRATFDYLTEIGVPLINPKVVLNDVFAHQMLTPADIEGALGVPIAVRIPHDPLLFQRAVNEGNPISLLAPKSPQAGRFEFLGRFVVGEDVPQDTTAAAPRKRRGLFGRT
jgi:pilus assembly protein CpaE